MSGFHDVRFPLALALGARGGPERLTEIVRYADGREARNAVWSASRRRWDVGGGTRSLGDLQALLAFFEARQGRLHGFRFRDFADNTSREGSGPVTPFDQPLGIGDGQTRSFQLIKRYQSGPGVADRPITKPFGTVRVGVNGVELATGFAIDPLTGRVDFDAAPAEGAVLTAGFEFDCAARFDLDQIEASVIGPGAVTLRAVPLVEIA